MSLSIQVDVHCDGCGTVQGGPMDPEKALKATARKWAKANGWTQNGPWLDYCPKCSTNRSNGP